MDQKISIGTIIEFLSNFLKYENTNPNAPESGVVYGGRLAGGEFSLLEFIKKPQVIFRSIGLFFSIIVFASIASEESYKRDVCPLNENSSACGFGVSIGVLAFLACILFLIVDARFDSLSNIKTRKKLVIGDFLFSALWSFMWFVCFCVLLDSWRKTDDNEKENAERHKIQTSIAFSFFSIFIWIALSLLAFMRYRQGSNTLFNNDYVDPTQDSVISNNYNFDTHTNAQAPFTNNEYTNAGYQQNLNY